MSLGLVRLRLLGLSFFLFKLVLPISPAFHLFLVDLWLHEQEVSLVVVPLHLGQVRVLLLELLPLAVGNLDWVDDGRAIHQMGVSSWLKVYVPSLSLFAESFKDADISGRGFLVIESCNVAFRATSEDSVCLRRESDLSDSDSLLVIVKVLREYSIASQKVKTYQMTHIILINNS